METLKKLRELSGAGIGDCKKALDEARGDIEKAVEILRKKGIAKAAKRSERVASEGLIMVDVNGAQNEGYILEVNAETDFVARNDKFKEFADKCFALVKSGRPASRDELLALKMGENTVQQELDSLSGIIGEKLDIKNAATLASKGTVAAYSHMGGKIGVLVALDKPEQTELAKSVAMQIAASSPAYIRPEDVPADVLEAEKNIYREQLINEGKPENIIDKIIAGKVRKYYQEVCLVEQEYIMDDKKTVQDILGEVKVEGFIRSALDGKAVCA